MIDSLIKKLEVSTSLLGFLQYYYGVPVKILPEDTVVCFGLNDNTEKLLKLFSVDFIVDDCKAGDIIFNTPIIKKEQVPKGCVIINCSFSIYPYTVYSISDSLKPDKIIPFTQIAAFSNESLVPSFVKDTYECWSTNLEKLTWLYSCLEDDESKAQLLNVLLYRLTGDNCLNFGFSVDFNRQYFESFITPHAKGVFVDGGGFTGDTAQGYLNFFENDFTAIHIFEPDKGNCTEARKRLINFSNIHIYQVGISDEKKLLNFCSLNTTFSAFSESGKDEIAVTTIDDQVKGRIDYLKLDVEGFDLKAIKGAKEHIIHDTPCMAISVYHDANHFWQIPEHVLSLNNNYKLRFRHYSEGWSESVVYFLPKS
ncbi:FkbM family methyltransferase [Pseudoalteromonas sp. MMG012]|uniref:FkbM family methyltransferase n=1 Tax=Pseudoalteromonas sp. MMG012 TaxID=2822686 RepID=UPI001B3A2292|nr:FkbM family methyltransferase [Pseudoalteromonas sp. MMG012]MBQ4849017.1 FkbM family methyltransferase [Pseudoalteromonas sp. MMG012]